jgi:acetyltransferase-like isoleucine patch superfamily enzyme
MNRMLGRVKLAMRKLLSLTVVVFPLALKVGVYRRVFGYKIGRRVKIGLSWINVEKLEIGDYVMIGNFNRFKSIPSVRIGDHTRIGLGNTFTSTTEFTNPQRIALRGNRPELIIGCHCGISMLHYFDVQDTFTIGSFTTIAGTGSVFFTHYLDVLNAKQMTRPITIGDYCMVGSNARFVPGAGVANCSVVGMGAVLTKLVTETHVMIGGNPAVIVRRLPEDAAYFKRTVGWIGEFSQSPEGTKQAGNDRRP